MLSVSVIGAVVPVEAMGMGMGNGIPPEHGEPEPPYTSTQKPPPAYV